MIQALNIPEKDPISFAIALQTVVYTEMTVFSSVVAIVNTVMSLYSMYDSYQIHAKLNKINHQLSEQLNIIESGFNSIERKIDRLAEEIKDTNIKSTFKRKEAHLKNLKVVFDRFLKRPNHHTMADLKRECHNNQMLYFADYVKHEIRSNDDLSLKTMMMRKNDLKKFGTWSKMLGQSLAKAMLLHGYCLGVIITDNSTMKEVVAVDKDLFLDIIKDLANFIPVGAKQIRRDYMRFVKDDVWDYAKDHKDQGNQDFTSSVYSILNTKYYFRYWFVISYNGDTWGSDFHEFSYGPHVLSWMRQLNRCVYITSTNSRRDINGKLNRCTKERDSWYWAANHIYGDVSHCMGPNNGLIVVRGTQDARATFSSGTYTYIWTHRSILIHTYKRDYLVHVMPPEIDED